MNLEISNIKKGQKIEGVVVQVEPNTIYLDIQAFTEGKIHLDNYSKPQLDTFEGIIKVGDKVEAVIQKITHEPNPLILLSRLPLYKEKNQQKIAEAIENNEVVEGKVKQVIARGILLDFLGFEVLIPFSQLDRDLIEDKDNLVGRKLTFNILKEERRGRYTNIIGSRKQIVRELRNQAYQERQELRAKELETIQTGDVLTGTVDKLEKHAATIKFNHVVGLLRISQVSHHRIEKIEDVLELGQSLDVKVIKKEGNRLDLSLKVLQKTPYQQFVSEHKKNQTVLGKVFQKLPFGLIVELALDVRGLLHRNEYSWNPDDNFQDFVNIGDEIEVMIVNFDKQKERIALSRKALTDNPWKDVNVKRGDKVSAIINTIDRDGVIVTLQGVNAVIPLNELSNEKIGKPEEHFEVGQEVVAIVTDINTSRWEIKLSIRRLEAQIERKSFEKYLTDDENDNDNVTIGDLFGDELKGK